MIELWVLENRVTELSERVKKLNKADWVALYYANMRWTARAMLCRSVGESFGDPFQALDELEKHIRALEDMQTLGAAE